MALIPLKARTGIAALAAAPLLDLAPSAFANLLIIPTIDSSISENANAIEIEVAIEIAILRMEDLYSNSVTIPVTFTYQPDSVLMRTKQ